MNLSAVINVIKSVTKQYRAEIFVGIGIAGMASAAVMAVQATPKALRLIEEANAETPLEKVKVCWRSYIPAIFTGVISAGFIINANSIKNKQHAALITAYALSEASRSEYREKVLDMIGEKKERAVREAIAGDKIRNKPVTSTDVIVTGKGTMLCCDLFSGRYFYSDIEKIKQVVNELNRVMLRDGSVSLNDFYYEIGLSANQIGDDLGWDVDKGLIELDFSAQLNEDKTPCLALEFVVPPKYDY